MIIELDGGEEALDVRAAGPPGAVPARSNWVEAAALLPDVARLLRTLAGHPRVPWRAKLVAGAAAAYALGPGRRPTGMLPGGGLGLDDALVLTLALRHLIAAAGYDLVRACWTGSDDGFALLVVLAGVDR